MQTPTPAPRMSVRSVLQFIGWAALCAAMFVGLVLVTQNSTRQKIDVIQDRVEDAISTFGDALDIHAEASGLRSCATVSMLAEALNQFDALTPNRVERLRKIGCRVVLPVPRNKIPRPLTPNEEGHGGDGTAVGPVPSSEAPSPVRSPSARPSASQTPTPSQRPSPDPSPKPTPTICIGGAVCVTVSIPPIGGGGDVTGGGGGGSGVPALVIGVGVAALLALIIVLTLSTRGRKH